MPSNLLSQDVLPIGTGYAILMGVLATGLWLQRRDAGGADADQADATRDEPVVETGPGGKKPGLIARQFPPGWPRFCAQIVSIALGGYVLLMAVDLLYYYGVARVAGQFIESAVSGGALLVAITLPLFAGASWLELRRRNR